MSDKPTFEPEKTCREYWDAWAREHRPDIYQFKDSDFFRAGFQASLDSLAEVVRKARLKEAKDWDGGKYLGVASLERIAELENPKP